MALVRHRKMEPEAAEWWPFRGFEWPESVGELIRDTGIKVEEFEDEGTMVIRAEVPGIDPEKDVEITLADNVLRIRAERREETKKEEKQRYRSEFRYGAFSRAVELPAGATEEDVKASYRDGILEVRVPISTARAEARTIPVTRG